MNPARDTPTLIAPRPSPRRALWPIGLIVVLCAGVELVLVAADQGWLGSSTWRRWAYANGAFWPGLLRDWQPNYRGQPAAMFLTYSVLHAGPGHLAGNIAALCVLGRHLGRAMGPWRFLGLYLFSALGGAVAYALLSTSPSPMVGASGAIFGLAGAAIEMRRAEARNWRGAVTGFVGLLLVNALSWGLAGGHLAWQAHLGGAIAGAAAMAALQRRPRHPTREKTRS